MTEFEYNEQRRCGVRADDRFVNARAHNTHTQTKRQTGRQAGRQAYEWAQDAPVERCLWPSPWQNQNAFTIHTAAHMHTPLPDTIQKFIHGCLYMCVAFICLCMWIGGHTDKQNINAFRTQLYKIAQFIISYTEMRGQHRRLLVIFAQRRLLYLSKCPCWYVNDSSRRWSVLYGNSTWTHLFLSSFYVDCLNDRCAYCKSHHSTEHTRVGITMRDS